MDRKDFVRMLASGALASTIPYSTQTNDSEIKMTKPADLELNRDKFSFAIIADPQLGHASSNTRVNRNSSRTLVQSINEINQMEPQPEFILFLGDLVNVPDRPSFEHFLDCIQGARMPKFWVHGNHDTRPPYSLYKEYEKKDTGRSDMFYSWNMGKWHMATIPCNLAQKNHATIEVKEAMLAWLEKDLAANRDKPTMIFAHLPMVPQGLSQLEWYTYELETRKKLIDLFTQYENVKWYLNGHVHNGIKTAQKISRTYKGINFFTCPTIIESRNFGEEFAKYSSGLNTGGYYMIVEVDGVDVKIKGRLAGVDEAYIFPSKFKKLKEDDEPRWFKRIVDFEPTDDLINGDFDQGFEGWNQALRYEADENPAFVTAINNRFRREGKHSAYIFTKAKSPEFWARDENNHIYQVVKAPSGRHHIFEGSYYIEDRPDNGGGYLRISGINGREFKFLMMFKWGNNEMRADYLPRCIGYEIHGTQQSWSYLYELGKKRKAFFWEVKDDPGEWHDLQVDIPDMYNRCIGESDAFNNIGITKYHVSLGTWNNREVGTESHASFDSIALRSNKSKIESKNDNKILAVNEMVFMTRFGQDLTDRVRIRTKGNEVMNPPVNEIKW